MIKQFRYYVVDSVAEKFIGSFFASSHIMAVRILKTFDVSKAKLTWDDIEVYMDPNPVVEYETVSELRSLKKGQIVGVPLDDVVNGSLFIEDDKHE